MEAALLFVILKLVGQRNFIFIKEMPENFENRWLRVTTNMPEKGVLIFWETGRFVQHSQSFKISFNWTTMLDRVLSFYKKHSVVKFKSPCPWIWKKQKLGKGRKFDFAHILMVDRLVHDESYWIVLKTEPKALLFAKW